MPQLLPLLLYLEYQNGASVAELATAFKMTEFAVRERLQATRLCLERQIRVETEPIAA
jgi:hypothetical protein